MTTQEVRERIAWSTGTRADTLHDLVQGVNQLKQRCTVLVDALDEAQDPEGLITGLINLLSREAGMRIRFLLGTRRHLVTKLQGPQESQLRVLDLDHQSFADPDSIRSCVRNILVSSDPMETEYKPSGIYRKASEDLVNGVAAAISTAAGNSFLIAKITAMTEATAERVPDVDNAAWRNELPRRAGPAMRRDLHMRLGPQASRAAELLLPIAYGLGDGLPWEDVWPRLASALSAEHNRYDQDDILWLRRAAGSYVVEGNSATGSVYRIFHRALAEHLLEGRDQARDHATIMDVLLSRVETKAGRRQWRTAHGYTREHILGHAAYAGMADDLLTDPGLMLASSRSALLSAFDQQKEPPQEVERWRRVFRRASPQLRTASLQERPAYLRLAALYEGLPEIAQEFDAFRYDSTWWPQWTHYKSNRSPAYVIGTRSHIEDFRIATISDRDYVVCILGDGRITVQDLEHGTVLFESSPEYNARPMTIECLSVGADREGQPLFAFATGSIVHVWDLRSSKRVRALEVEHERVTAITFATHHGRALLIVGAQNIGSYAKGVAKGSITVWDIETGRPSSPPTSCGAVRALSFATLRGQPVVVLSAAGQVSAYNLESRQMLADPIIDKSQQFSELSVISLGGRPVVLASGRRGYTAFDLESHAYFSLGHPAPDNVSTSRRGFRQFLLTRFTPGHVVVSDPKTGATLGHAFISSVGRTEIGELEGKYCAVSLVHGHLEVAQLAEGDGRVPELGDDANPQMRFAVASFDGEGMSVGKHVVVRGPKADHSISGHLARVSGWPPLLVVLRVKGKGNQVRVFNHETGALLFNPYEGHAGGVLGASISVLDERPVAISWSQDRSVQVWDPTTNQLKYGPLRAHTAAVTGVELAQLDGRSVLVAGSLDGTVSVWDFDTGLMLDRFVVPDPWGAVDRVRVIGLRGHLHVVISAKSEPSFRDPPGHGLHLLNLVTGAWRFFPLSVGEASFYYRITDLHVSTINGRAIAVTVGSNGYINCIDLESGTDLYAPVKLGALDGPVTVHGTLCFRVRGVMGDRKFFDAVRGRTCDFAIPLDPFWNYIGHGSGCSTWAIADPAGLTVPSTDAQDILKTALRVGADEPEERNAGSSSGGDSITDLDRVGNVQAVAVLPSSQGEVLVAGNALGQVHTWSLADGRRIRPSVNVIDPVPDDITFSTHEGDLLLISTGVHWGAPEGGRKLQIWNLSTQQRVAELQLPAQEIESVVAASHRGRLLVVFGSRDDLRNINTASDFFAITSEIQLIDASRGRVLRRRRLQGQLMGLGGIAVLGSGRGARLVTVSRSGEVALWKLATLSPVRRVFRPVQTQLPYRAVSIIQPTPDGRALLVGSGGDLVVLALPGLETLEVLEFRLGGIEGLILHPCSGQLVVTAGRELVFHRLGDPACNATHINLGSQVNSVTTSSGTLVAVGTDSGVVVLDVPWLTD